MRYFVRTKELRGRGGDLIKRLSCPFALKPDDLKNSGAGKTRFCGLCNSVVYETSRMSEEEIRGVVSSNADTCLVILPDQSNIEIES